MDPSSHAVIMQQVMVLCIAVFIGTSLSLTAWKGGFYHLTPQPSLNSSISGLHVFCAFCIFICVELVLVPSFYLLWISFKQGALLDFASFHPDSKMQGWINVLGMVCTGLALLIYYATLEKEQQNQIWGVGSRNKNQRKWQPLINLSLGALTWVIAYPWIIALSQLIGIIQQFSHTGTYVDQLAVKHLREALSDPALLSLTVVAVVTIVPILEELLFRGFMQTWLKSMLGLRQAVIMTSIVFAAFHYSASQGSENFELLLSLFLLSCFLGFIRERQNSLWASIGLHATFNFASLLMILVGGF